MNVNAEASFTSLFPLTEELVQEIREVCETCAYGEPVIIRTDTTERGARLYVSFSLGSSGFADGVARKVVVEERLKFRLTDRFELMAD